MPYLPDGVAFVAALVTLVAFAVYLRTMLPSTGFWDTAEAQTVPFTLSIFHPTGFPTYTLIGWAWSQLPIGEVAFRMNLLSGVAMAISAGLVTLTTGHLVVERPRVLVAAACGVAGATFAFASEPWENATRADVHALNTLFVALIAWLLVTWRAAERAGSPRAGGWLLAGALAFGIGLGNHPLVGLMAFGIGAWLFVVDWRVWRRWRLFLGCAVLIAIGLTTFAYIPIRAAVDPEPPLFYARPDTWERLRYLVFAEQFRDLFEELGTPLVDLGRKWQEAEAILERQYIGPGWLLVAAGAAILAVRQPGAAVLLAGVVVATVVYAMNFNDGDIDRYYLPTVVATAPLLGVATAAIAGAVARAVAEVSRHATATIGRRRLARAAGAVVVTLAASIPATSLVTSYRAHDQSENREADRWVASVHHALPPNAVIISWWSYSTPLWYHRWVLGERPDVTIIDERNILDDGYRTMAGAINAFLGERPVYLVPPPWALNQIAARWETRAVPTYPGYLDLELIEGPRGL